MEKVKNKNGFALVETLVCAVFVCAVFMLLIVNYYPMLGKIQRYQNYDNVEDKYIAFYLGQLIRENSDIFSSTPGNPENGNTLTVFNTENNATDICDRFIHNSEQCKSFISISNITHVFYTNYSTAALKNKIAEDADLHISRAFELYAKYMPTHSSLANKKEIGETRTRDEKYVRIIVERKLVDDKSGKNIYRYSNIEVEK